jgi:hypothetical protein
VFILILQRTIANKVNHIDQPILHFFRTLIKAKLTFLFFIFMVNLNF